ncbi:serine hydrolase domain-containing protein [Sphingosinicella rhizophila]|uniref:Serine hydrolase domain-containing protein n=1 Tax=Sphingosinicella rhizophila TaxID=3050082 RepID=A0ABU3QAT1_9SPHN|nr:serine hydrolase domain-containing protein [Sphingosinicella sp. GR2756]MDT9600503.1 serine hydrolase domain-containing protein [Sphingosinicella sp. GR2756]
MTAEDLNAWLDGFVPLGLDKGDIAGAVIVVVKDGRILTKRGFGYADVAARRPVDPDRTLFRPASTSKLFTWTAVMQLVEQGKIHLDADVNQYLDFRIPPRDGKPITMRNIMTHTAGFEEQVKWILAHDRPPPHYSDILKSWIPERVFAPGTTPAYSNYATSLAGYIVERVSGEPYVDYVERHIFRPLGMSDSTGRQPLPPRLAAMMSKGYMTASEEPKPFEMGGPVPAGAFTTSGADMANFMIAHLQDGTLGSARILRPETARMMHDTAHTMVPGAPRMLLGFYEQDLNGHRIIAHGGDSLQFHTMLSLFPDDNVGLFFSMNSAGRGAGSLRDALVEGFADRYFLGRPDTRRVDPETAAKHARMMTGLWANSRASASNFFSITQLLGQQEISVDGKGKLVIGSGGGAAPRPEWVEVTPFVWKDMRGHGTLAAQLVGGQIVRVATSPVSVFDRVAWYKSASWLLPAFYASLAIFLLAILLWPLRALVRRHYGASLTLDRKALIAHRLTGIAAILYLAVVGSWASIIGLKLYDLNESLDARLLFTQVLTIIVLFGGFAVMTWNLWLVWRGDRKWTAKLWSVALLLAGLVMLWIGIVFHLLEVGTSF